MCGRFSVKHPKYATTLCLVAAKGYQAVKQLTSLGEKWSVIPKARLKRRIQMMIFTRISSIYQVSASYASHRANDQNIQKNDTAKIMLCSWVPIFDTYYLLLLSVIVRKHISASPNALGDTCGPPSPFYQLPTSIILTNTAVCAFTQL